MTHPTIAQPYRVTRRPAFGDSSIWNAEYGEARAIPSSYRVRPSRGFSSAMALVQLQPGAKVLDAGCGTGRHTILMASLGCAVDAIDVSDVAAGFVAERLSKRPELAGSVRIETGCLTSANLPDERYDLVIDSYVSCHILDDDSRLQYLDGLAGLLTPGGVLYTSVMGDRDEYYQAHLEQGSVATDPLNGVSKHLLSESQFVTGLHSLGHSPASSVESFNDRVGGRSFHREVLAGTIRRI